MCSLLGTLQALKLSLEFPVECIDGRNVDNPAVSAVSKQQRCECLADNVDFLAAAHGWSHEVPDLFALRFRHHIDTLSDAACVVNARASQLGDTGF